jgi:hypothetical protein
LIGDNPDAEVFFRAIILHSWVNLGFDLGQKCASDLKPDWTDRFQQHGIPVLAHLPRRQLNPFGPQSDQKAGAPI